MYGTVSGVWYTCQWGTKFIGEYVCRLRLDKIQYKNQGQTTISN